MPNKLVKFCSITKYIEQIDKDLYSVIENLCLHRLFTPRRSGITFLYPADAAYKKKIITLSQGSNAEEAVKIMQSLVIIDHMPSPSDFVNKKDDVPNALKQKLEIGTADAKSVKIGKGTATLDTKFVPLEGKKLAVYKLTGTTIPLDGAEASLKYIRSKKEGGAVEQAPADLNNRCCFATTLEDNFKHYLEDRNALKDPYVEPVVSFCLWCKMKNMRCMDEVKKCLDWSPAVSFYLIFEPHSSAPSVVDDLTFKNWYSETNGKFPAGEAELKQAYINVVDMCATATEESLQSRCDIQQELIAQPFKPTLAANALLKYNNDIKSAARDELRMLINMKMMDLYTEKNTVARYFVYVKLIEYVRLIGCDVSDDQSKLMLLNQQFQNLNDVCAWVSSSYAMVRSDVFLHQLIPSALIESDMLGVKDIESNITTNELINLSYNKYQLFQKIPACVSIDQTVMNTLAAMYKSAFNN